MEWHLNNLKMFELKSLILWAVPVLVIVHSWSLWEGIHFTLGILCSTLGIFPFTILKQALFGGSSSLRGCILQAVTEHETVSIVVNHIKWFILGDLTTNCHWLRFLRNDVLERSKRFIVGISGTLWSHCLVWLVIIFLGAGLVSHGRKLLMTILIIGIFLKGRLERILENVVRLTIRALKTLTGRLPHLSLHIKCCLNMSALFGNGIIAHSFICWFWEVYLMQMLFLLCQSLEKSFLWWTLRACRVFALFHFQNSLSTKQWAIEMNHLHV